MNEEITFAMGLDTGPFFSGIQKSKGLMSELKVGADKLGGAIKEAFIGFIAFEALAKFSEAIEGAKQFGKEIRTTAENIGVGTDFLQKFTRAARQTGSDSESAEKGLAKLSQQIGEAREKGGEAADKFKNWGVALDDVNGNALSVEEVASRISKRMNEIEDPTKRAALAMDLMGKSGRNLVTTLKELDDFKKSSGGFIVTTGELAVLDELEKKSDRTKTKIKTGFAKTLAFFAQPITGKDIFVEQIRGNSVEPIKPSESPEIKAAKVKELVKAYRELQQAQNGGGLNEASKLAHLYGERDEIAAQLADKTLTEIERVKIQIELQKKVNDIAEQKKKLVEETQKKQTEADTKKREAAEKQKTLQDEFNHALREERDAERKLNETKEKRYQLSISELASSRIRFGGQLGDDQQTARRITELERQGEWNRLHGYIDDAKDRFTQADDLRKQLSTNVVESDRDPYREQWESIAKDNRELARIAKKGEIEGIKIIPILTD